MDINENVKSQVLFYFILNDNNIRAIYHLNPIKPSLYLIPHVLVFLLALTFM